MRQILHTSMNEFASFSYGKGETGAKAVIELVLTSAETEYEVGNDGDVRRRIECRTDRFFLYAGALRELAAQLIKYAEIADALNKGLTKTLPPDLFTVAKEVE